MANKSYTKDDVITIMVEWGYNPGAIDTYLQDVERAGHVCPLGPVRMIAKDLESGVYRMVVVGDK